MARKMMETGHKKINPKRESATVPIATKIQPAAEKIPLKNESIAPKISVGARFCNRFSGMLQYSKKEALVPTQEQVTEVIKQCYDPEIPINIWDLGLIYEVDAKPDSVYVKMSLTSAGCPAAQSLPEQVRQRISSSLGVKNVNVEVTFEPAWTPEKISPEGRKKLGIPDSEEGANP